MNNEQITVPKAYIKLVSDTRAAQNAYFEAALTAKKVNTPEAWGIRKEKLVESRSLEAQLDNCTEKLLSSDLPKMTADEAIAQMKKNLEGKEVDRG